MFEDEGARRISEIALEVCGALRPSSYLSFGECRPLTYSEAGELYWTTDLPTKEIAEAYNIKGGATAIWIAVGPAILGGVECFYCGGDIVVRSRSELTAALLREPKDLICIECNRDREYRVWEERRHEEQLEKDYRRQLKYMPYKDYLKTDHWQDIRKSALLRAGYRCQLCNGQKPLQVHHRTYERRGMEWPEDVIALCGGCHGAFHQKMQVEGFISSKRTRAKAAENADAQSMSAIQLEQNGGAS